MLQLFFVRGSLDLELVHLLIDVLLSVSDLALHTLSFQLTLHHSLVIDC